MMHTPDKIQDFVKLLAEKYQPLQIISFGMEHRYKQCSSCFAPEGQESHYQHFLLMVTESDADITDEVQDFAKQHYRQGTVVILVHGKEHVQDAIGDNSRFFITVYRQGTLLYWEDGMKLLDLAPAYLPVGATTNNAQKYFEHHQLMAEGFLHTARECMDNRHFILGMFMLHQAVEQCTAGLIMVFMGCRTEVYRLRRQLLLCNCFSPMPARFFLTGNAEDERLFNILVKSYTYGRYEISFQGTETDLAKLMQRVLEFAEMTMLMCEIQCNKGVWWTFL